MVNSRYDFLNDEIKDHLDRAIRSTLLVRRRHPDVVVEIFLKLTHFAITIWDQHLRLSTERRHFRYEYPLVPLPDEYQPGQYIGYENDLENYIENYLVQKGYDGIYGHVFNLGTVAKPEMHLVLSKGPLRREYLGAWIQGWSDEEEARGGAPPDSSSLAGNLEAGNLPVEPGSSKNGESAQEIDTYQFRKRLAELTREPTERAPRPPTPPQPDDL